MSEILRLILPFFGVLFLGYGAGRLRRVSEDGLAGLDFFVTYLAMPALFFRLVAATPLTDAGGFTFVVTTTFSTYCAFAIAFSLGALTNGGQITQGTIQGLVGSYSNIAMLAPALVLPAFGAAAALPMALVFTFDNALVVATAPLMMTLGGTVRVDSAELAQKIARQALLHPLVIATILGLIFAFTGLTMPQPIDAIFAMLGGAAAPAALFVVGVSLAGRTIDRLPPELPVLIGIKLIAHPLIVYLLLSWVGDFDPVWVRAAVLMAALPPATGVIAIARDYKSYGEWATVGVLLGTVISISTVTVVLILLVRDVLPADPFQ
jgi:predicted permease